MMKSFNKNQKFLMLSVAFVMALKLLGIFLVLPVFTLYGKDFTDSAVLVGVALGIYGFGMAIFQTPFGKLSDRFGRKKIIIMGMIPYIIGNLIAWHPINIYGLIVGRFIAGSAAISSAGLAFVQESVPPNKRNLAMAVVGIPVGLSFMLGIVIGPVISGMFGIASLFLISAFLGVISLIPFSRVEEVRVERKPKERKEVGRIDPRSFLVGGVGFIVSLYMIVFFYNLPLFASKFYGISDYFEFLLPAIIIGGVVAIFSSMYADKGKTTLFALIALVVMLISSPLVLLMPVLTKSGIWFEFGTIVFLVGFSISEIIFPPLVTKLTLSHRFGANIGTYQTMQNLGQFFGGIVAGFYLTLSIHLADVIKTTSIVMVLMAIAIIFLYAPTKFKEVTVDSA